MASPDRVPSGRHQPHRGPGFSDHAGTAIRVASVTMRTWGTPVGVAASMTLPRLAEGPIRAGHRPGHDGGQGGTAGRRGARCSGADHGGPSSVVQLRTGEVRGVDGAHVFALHCPETAPQLADRLKYDDPKVKVASTFSDRATAQRSVQAAIDSDQERVARWLAESRIRFLEPSIHFEAHDDALPVRRRRSATAMAVFVTLSPHGVH